MASPSASLAAHSSSFVAIAPLPATTRVSSRASPQPAAPSVRRFISNIFFFRPRPPPPPPKETVKPAGKIPAPGRYGGPPIDKRIRQSWGGKKEDPLTSGDYIWNTEWKKSVKVDDGSESKEKFIDPIADAVSSNDPDTSEGFLSIGRSMAMDSMDVDLSAELGRPSRASLERQVQRAQEQSPSSSSSSPDSSIRWRYAPTTREEKRWEKANRKNAKMVTAFVVKDAPLDPAEIAAREQERFQELKQTLLLLTVAMGSAFTGMAFTVYPLGTAISYSVGMLGSLAYIRMLSSSVEALGANTVGGAVRGAVGQPRLLVPVLLVMTFNRWNEILVPDYGLIPLELVPMLVGFFTYKAATVVQAFQDILTPMAPAGMPSSSESSSASLSALTPASSEANGSAAARADS